MKLWKLIRRSHLTYIYGDGDCMSFVNIHDQSVRYNYMKQGDRESIAEFKTRFDNQIKANQGVGIPDIDEKLRAMDFMGKLDPRGTVVCSLSCVTLHLKICPALTQKPSSSVTYSIHMDAGRPVSHTHKRVAFCLPR